MDQVTADSDRVTVVSRERAATLVDELRRQERLLGAVQAQRAALMVEFGDVRRGLDQQEIGARSAADGGEARYTAGEFAVTEISLAVTASKYGISRVLGMTRRLQAEAPDVWDSWCAGDIDHDKALRINRALRRLVKSESKELLNNLVVKVAPHKTPELLGRWLNQFIARAEPDETDERLRRSFEERYVSIRPDIDGISFLHAALSCVDAAAIDQLLTALAGDAAPGDDRTLAQRRADALVDVLCGRMGNGCHGPAITGGYDTNSDADDHLDDHLDGAGVNSSDGDGAHDDGGKVDGARGDHTTESDKIDDRTSDAAAGNNSSAADPDIPWDDDDFDLPATAFRPEADGPDADSGVDPDDFAETDVETEPAAPSRGSAAAMVAGCTCSYRHHPLPVTIGVVVTASALFGYSNMPGQLADRSSRIPADIIRDLAAQTGTLFHRLLTDDSGNLLEVTNSAELRPLLRRVRRRPVPQPETRHRRRLPRRHVHQRHLPCPGPPLRSRPRHPAPRRTHHGAQHRQRLPNRPSGEDARRPPDQQTHPAHHHLDHSDRTLLPPRRPTAAGRYLASTSNHRVSRSRVARATARAPKAQTQTEAASKLRLTYPHITNLI
jgi:hypothetical protein